MLNARELKYLRTKEELINYFKEMGKNITEEEIENLKKSYAQAEEEGNTLSLQQLNDVAGGIKFFIRGISGENGQSTTIFKYLDDNLLTITVVDYRRHSLTDPAKPYVDKNMTTQEFLNKYSDHKFVNSLLNDAVDIDTGIKLKVSYDAKSLQTNAQSLIAEIYDMRSEPDFNKNLEIQIFKSSFHMGLSHLLSEFEGELKSIGETLNLYVKNKNPRVQSLVDLAARHVTAVRIVPLKEAQGGLMHTNNFIDLASAETKFPKDRILIHEMAHCLDTRQHCSEHMKDVINRTYIDKIKFMKIFETKEQSKSFELLTIMRIVRRLPNSCCRYTLYMEENKDKEIFARLFELYVATDGKWIIPEFNLKEIFPMLIDAFEREIQTVFDRAKSVGIGLLSEAVNMPAYVEGLQEKDEMHKLGSVSYDCHFYLFRSSHNKSAQFILKMIESLYGTECFKVLTKFKFQEKDIFIYLNRGELEACGNDSNGEFFRYFVHGGANRVTDVNGYDLFNPTLNGLILKECKPFVSRYAEYEFYSGNMYLNREVKFERTKEIIKVVVDGASYDVTEYVDPNNPNKRLYSHSSLKLEKKHTANSEIIYVIPTKNGEYYRCDFKYKTFGEKIEEELFDVQVSEVPEKSLPAVDPNTTTTTTTAPAAAVKPDVGPAIVTDVAASSTGSNYDS